MSSKDIYSHQHFIDNKYRTLYFKIINNAKNRAKPESYCENHHIIPRSMGGSDFKENLVALTGREHFICHYLLIKFALGKGKISMLYAFNRMKPNKKYKHRYFNSRLYSASRKDFSSAVSKSQIGRKHNPTSLETKKKLSEKALGVRKSEETKEKMRKPKDEKHRKNISSARKGIIFSNEHKNEISKSISKNEYTCTSPTKEVIITHSLYALAKKFDLCVQKCIRFSNRGIIPKASINSSIQRINCTGWKIESKRIAH